MCSLLVGVSFVLMNKWMFFIICCNTINCIDNSFRFVNSSKTTFNKVLSIGVIGALINSFPNFTSKVSSLVGKCLSFFIIVVNPTKILQICNWDKSNLIHIKLLINYYKLYKYLHL